MKAISSIEELNELASKNELVGLFQVPNELYHAGPGISRSDLDKLRRSPAHYLAAKANPMEQSKAMAFGQALHDCILTPSLFETLYVVRPEGLDGRSKAGKDWATVNEGKVLLSHDEGEAIAGIKKAIFAHPFASQFFKDGEPETAVYWVDALTGLLCKCKPDWLRKDNLIVDLKTTVDASMDEFARSIWSYGYHRQAAWYSDGVSEATGQKIQNFVNIACEKEPPYAIALYDIDDGSMDKGREEYRKLLDRLSECKSKNEWPAYPVEVQPIAIPHWAWSKE